MRIHPNGQFLIVQHRDDKAGVTLWDLVHQRPLVLPKEIATPIAATWRPHGWAFGDCNGRRRRSRARISRAQPRREDNDDGYRPRGVAPVQPRRQRLARAAPEPFRSGNIIADDPPISVELPTRSRLVTLTFSPSGRAFADRSGRWTSDGLSNRWGFSPHRCAGGLRINTAMELRSSPCWPTQAGVC